MNRRHFLSSFAILGAAPIWSRLDLLAWQESPQQFTGDNFELAHKLLFDVEATIKAGAPEVHPDTWKIVEHVVSRAPRLKALMYECEHNDPGLTIETFQRLNAMFPPPRRPA